MTYNSDGSVNVTPVSGSSYTGLYAADGSWNVVVTSGTSITGRYHPCGALNVVIATSGNQTGPAPSGALYVSPSNAYITGTLKVSGLSAQTTVGGVAPEAAGTGMYSGYTLSWGNDFLNSNVLVGPQNPTAPFFPTKNYGGAPRGNTTSLGTAYDSDPLTTGYQDVNRGVAAGLGNMSVANSVIRLSARKATPTEQTFFTPTDPSINGGVRPQISSMIHTQGCCGYYPTSNPVIVEAKIRFSSKTTNPKGWHPTFWMYSLIPPQGNTGNEIDLEGTSQALYFEHIDHNAGVLTTTSQGGFDYMDDQWHTHSFVLSDTAIQWYLDGALRATIAENANLRPSPSYAILSAHIVNGTFNNDTYSQASWDSLPGGAYMDVDWIRVWRKTGVTHWKPLQSVSDLNVAYNGTGSVVLPSALSLWGDAAVTEYVQVAPYDAYEPGNTTTSVFTQLPTGISYDAPTRTINVDFSSGTGNAGRSHVVVYGYKPDGSTMEPLRFVINRGPNITATSIEPTPVSGGGYSADLYYTADVGTIFPKSFAIPDLPAGWTLDSTTGLLTNSNPSVSGATVTLQVTNGAGQTASKSVTLWSPALTGALFTWDTTNATAMPNDGNTKVQYLYDIYDNSKRLAQSTAANRPLLTSTGGADGTRRVMSTVSNGASIRSDDADATNVAALVAAANTSNATTGTLYAVFAAKETSISTVNRILGWFNVSGTQSLTSRYTTTGRGATITASGGSQQVSDQAVQDTNMHVYEIIKNGNSLVFTVDGAAGGSLTVTQTGAITADLFILFGTQAGGAMVGQIGPGFFTKTIPNAADSLSARQWVASRMGVTTA